MQGHSHKFKFLSLVLRICRCRDRMSNVYYNIHWAKELGRIFTRQYCSNLFLKLLISRPLSRIVSSTKRVVLSLNCFLYSKLCLDMIIHCFKANLWFFIILCNYTFTQASLNTIEWIELWVYPKSRGIYV